MLHFVFASQPEFKMIKVAIAGTGGLAQLIARHLDQDTSHQFVLLSRKENSGLNENGYQVIPVDYNDPHSLQYALSGIDTVISTVTGMPELNLVDAAVAMGVRRFAPAEFEGSPTVRTLDILDRMRTPVLERLHYYGNHIEFTVFVCGIFYERFAPGGMASLGIGIGSGISGEGDYLMDVRNARAEIPCDPSGRLINICMTSADDVAKYVVRALDLPSWPAELSMCGQRQDVFQVVQQAQSVMGHSFQTTLQTAETLANVLTHYQSLYDYAGQLRTQSLIATLNGRYDFADATLNNI
ncbi:MAG: hypothetical protein M4579_002300, partial [Chaenotheca gracillima]